MHEYEWRGDRGLKADTQDASLFNPWSVRYTSQDYAYELYCLVCTRYQREPEGRPRGRVRHDQKNREGAVEGTWDNQYIRLFSHDRVVPFYGLTLSAQTLPLLLLTRCIWVTRMVRQYCSSAAAAVVFYHVIYRNASLSCLVSRATGVSLLLSLLSCLLVGLPKLLAGTGILDLHHDLSYSSVLDVARSTPSLDQRSSHCLRRRSQLSAHQLSAMATSHCHCWLSVYR